MSSLKPLRIILTRPAPQAQAWETALHEAGFDVSGLPLINIALLPAPASLPDLAQMDAVFLVSRNALDGLLAWYGAAALQNAALRWLCPGAGTAAQLFALGIPACRIAQPAADEPQDSLHLWQALQNHSPLQTGQQLLIVRGRDAGQSDTPNWLATQAQQLGLQVQHLISYERQPPELTVAQAELAQAAAQDGSVWLFSSSQAIANLTAALPDTTWRQARCLATHARIAHTAQQHGFQTTVCQPQLNDIARVLHQLHSA